ncbi:hypothetical protein EJK50_0853 [Moraxella catarrhalis]|nr:hypothetical protein EJK50_0866 [Moraxella catarrhalis]AZQ89381.1 hypothetical protein EJK50_0853 [Moraxella catarrhalis]
MAFKGSTMRFKRVFGVDGNHLPFLLLIGLVGSLMAFICVF